MLGSRLLRQKLTKLTGTPFLVPGSNLGIATSSRSFGLIQEYNERKNKKLINNFHLNEEPKFWVTSSRPSNFGDHLDVKTKADNWFDDNRLWNEENKDY